MRTILRITQGLVGAAGIVGVSLDQASIPSSDFWSDHKALLYLAIGALGVTAALAPIIEALLDYVNRFDHAARLALLELLLQTFPPIVDLSERPYSTIGLHVYVVRRPFRRFFTAEQQRIASLELPPRSESFIRWTRGKGVIGLCWEQPERGAVALNLTDAKKEHEASDRSAWDALAPAKRLGMSFDEFARTLHLGTVIACPVLDSSKASRRSRGYKGCVSVDSTGDSYAALFTPSVVEALKGCADSVLATMAFATRGS